MADIYELSVALDLRADVSDEEIAELRWQLGLGPRPVTLVCARCGDGGTSLLERSRELGGACMASRGRRELGDRP